MKKVAILFFVLSLGCFKAQTIEYIDLTRSIGKTINIYEKNRYELFPEIDEWNYKSARIWQIGDSVYELQIHQRKNPVIYIQYSQGALDSLQQTIESSKKKDAWKRRKNYFFQRIHLYTGIGVPFKLSGNTLETYSEHFQTAGNLESFTGSPIKWTKPKIWNLGIGYNITSRINISAWMLPRITKHFSGGNGVNVKTPDGYIIGSFWVLQLYKDICARGSKIDEDITSNAWSLNADYILIPYKKMRHVAVDLSVGGGMFLNRIQVGTRLWAYDIDSINDPNPYVYSDVKSYSQTATRLGVMATLNLNLYFGKYFSVFYRFNVGKGQAMDIKERSYTFHSVTATAPAHKEQLNGVGHTFGLAMHLIRNSTFQRMKKRTEATQIEPGW